MKPGGSRFIRATEASQSDLGVPQGTDRCQGDCQRGSAAESAEDRRRVSHVGNAAGLPVMPAGRSTVSTWLERSRREVGCPKKSVDAGVARER